MYAKLQRYWFVLPALSGALLIASFHPFNVWPLSFVALAPLYYFVAGYPARRLSIVFWGGFITGAIFAFSLSYFTLIQFHWLPEAYLFVLLVKLSVVPITLLSGALVGLLSTLVFRLLRSGSIALNALLGAAVYTAAELLWQTLFGGYYFALLAYAATPVPPLMGLAALGGASAVSFVVALVNATLVEGFIEWRTRRGAYLCTVAGLALTLFLLMAVAARFESLPRQPIGSLTVAIIQVGPRSSGTFGKEENGAFAFPALANRIREAATGSPGLIMYPFSPVEGALYRDKRPAAFNKPVLAANESSFARWLLPLAPSSTVMTWNTLYAEDKFFNEFEFFAGGEVVAEYQKQKLFPFMDYTPKWAQALGFYSTPYDMAAGGGAQAVSIAGTLLGSLMCSELHDVALARAEARRVPLIIAVGSEAMFIDDVASNFALRAAQFRAAEFGVPVVRGNLLGPSAIILRDGRIAASLPAGQEGIVRGELALFEPLATPYSRFGDVPLVAIICAILVGAWLSRSLSTATRLP